jgi:BirA family transcriptional regulator, biotin operon repressor / biotin---[acetyl-CoA-carboxylase] ligase
LHGATTRLADLISLGDRTLDDIAALVLSSLARAHDRLLADDFPAIAAELNRAWPTPRRVELTLAGQTGPALGLFTGIDSTGDLRLRTEDGETRTYDATQVALLRELE